MSPREVLPVPVIDFKEGDDNEPDGGAGIVAIPPGIVIPDDDPEIPLVVFHTDEAAQDAAYALHEVAQMDVVVLHFLPNSSTLAALMWANVGEIYVDSANISGIRRQFRLAGGGGRCTFVDLGVFAESFPDIVMASGHCILIRYSVR